MEVAVAKIPETAGIHEDESQGFPIVNIVKPCAVKLENCNSDSDESYHSIKDEQSENDIDCGEPLDTYAIAQQVKSTLKALNLPQRHLVDLKIVDCALGTLCVTLQKAGMPWQLLHPANRKAFRALSDWVKTHNGGTFKFTSVEPVHEEKPKSKRGRKKKTTTAIVRGRPPLHHPSSTTLSGYIVKRKRGRPRKCPLSAPTDSKEEVISKNLQGSTCQVLLNRQSVSEFSSAVSISPVSNSPVPSDINIKAVLSRVKQAIQTKKVGLETMAGQLGVVLPTLNRILNDNDNLPWSETSEFRRGLFVKLHSWLKDIDFKNASSSSGVSSCDETVKLVEGDDEELNNGLNLSSRPSSSSSDRQHFLLLSPGSKTSRQIETIKDIPPSPLKQSYEAEDHRDGELVWPHPIGFLYLNSDEIIFDEVINIGNRKRTLISQSRLTLKSGRHYGLVGPISCGKTALLRYIASYRKKEMHHLNVIYCGEQHDVPYGCSVTRAVEYVRQGLTVGDEYLMNPPLDDPRNLDSFHDNWRGLPEARARQILAGLGFERETQNSTLRDINPRLRARLPLARALFVEPTLLLLDEPTNCLDIDAVLFLQNYLQRYRKALIIVTNCPSLLDTVCTDFYRIESEYLVSIPGLLRSYSRLFCPNF